MVVDTETITRAALGRSVKVGDLYDVRNDQVSVSFVSFTDLVHTRLF